MIIIDGKSTGRIFDGVGGYTHGGMSRLLYDYPEPQRSQILDYMFTPKFGMSFPTLKTELPEDMFCGWGTEPSHAHSRAELQNPNCNRGYQWWLMEEAKKRNPKITFDVVMGGFPGWVGDQSKLVEGDPRSRLQRFFSSDVQAYLITFLECARSRGLDIHILTIWAEVTFLSPTLGMSKEEYKINYPGIGIWDPEIGVKWFIEFKKELKKQGFDVKLVLPVMAESGDDNPWKFIVEHMGKNREFRAAIDVMSSSYVTTSNEKTRELSALWGKPLWSVDQNVAAALSYFSTPQYTSRLIGEWLGGSALANIFNASYLDGRVTKWNVDGLVTAYYDILYMPGFGQMTAEAPWSGHYIVQPAVWAVAHTTQFAEPGWQYLDSALRQLPEGGTVVALKQDNDYSVIIETKDASKDQSIAFCVKNGLSMDKVYVWRSTQEEQFVRIDTITPGKDGCYHVKLEPNAIYSLTTTTGQQKGSYGKIPPLSLFPFPYSDDFNSYDLSKGSVPKYISTQVGAFELEEGKGISGHCLKQSVTQVPLAWMQEVDDGKPYTVVGDRDWTDYKVSVQAAFDDGEGSLSLLGRVQGGVAHTPGLMAESEGPELDFSPRGSYRLTLVPDGNCRLERTVSVGTTILGVSKSWPCQSCKPFGTSFHKLELIFDGLNIEAVVDGKSVVKIEDADAGSYANGMVGFATEWNEARFDDIKVEPIKTSVIRIDDNPESEWTYKFKYQGKGWKNLKDQGKTMFNGSCFTSNAVGDTAVFEFSGRRVRYVACRGPKNGIVGVSVDGGTETFIDQYAIEDKGSQVLWSSPVLKPGKHNLKIRITGAKGPGCNDTYGTIDAVDIIQ